MRKEENEEEKKGGKGETRSYGRVKRVTSGRKSLRKWKRGRWKVERRRKGTLNTI